MKKEDHVDNCFYFDISKQERDSAIRYLLGAIIKVRSDSRFPSNYYTYDEDVNVYLAHLLFAVSLPEYHEMAEPYLSTETSDVLRWVRATEDKTIRYFIFKVNADHLLMHTAVFDDLNRKVRKKIFSRPPRHHQEVAKLYYEQAATYHKRIYRKRTGVGDVLGKLAQYFDQYQEVLKRVRREYFHFVTSFKDQAFNQFLGEIRNYENGFLKKSKMDRFLDLYGRWLETKNPFLVREIREIAGELQAMDPQFRFNPDKEFYGDGGFQNEKKCA
ncbi:MAG: hypothetical protein FGM27_09125 [Candidatus Omnitrophica bacterium]|nr:hypothetical protein [Candidatus Omnitrophota bacterium]